MITLITGAPGAGKTAAAVSLLAEVAKGRPVYADGIPELKIAHIPLEDPTKWPELVPDGAAVVIDEVQRIWRPRGSGSKVPAAVEALETHRHHGLDFFLITQEPGLLDQNVRRLVGRHVHIRDVGLMGRWWYEWPEATNVAQFRTAPIKKRYTLNKKAFDLYRSASVHIKPIRSIPRSVIVFGVALLIFVYLFWRGYQSISAKINPEAQKPAPAASAPMSPAKAVQVVAEVSQAKIADGFERESSPAETLPERIGGCWATAYECHCVTNEARPMIIRLARADVCVRVASGDFQPHPSRPKPERIEEKPRAGDLPGAAASAVLIEG